VLAQEDIRPPVYLPVGWESIVFLFLFCFFLSSPLFSLFFFFLSYFLLALVSKAKTPHRKLQKENCKLLGWTGPAITWMDKELLITISLYCPGADLFPPECLCNTAIKNTMQRTAKRNRQASGMSWTRQNTHDKGPLTALFVLPWSWPISTQVSLQSWQVSLKHHLFWRETFILAQVGADRSFPGQNSWQIHRRNISPLSGKGGAECRAELAHVGVRQLTTTVVKDTHCTALEILRVNWYWQSSKRKPQFYLTFLPHERKWLASAYIPADHWTTFETPPIREGPSH
jgi:hypothetical protein